MEVNKIIYIVLAFFLGGFGVHKFYAGKTMSGFLHLAFFWTGIHIIAIISGVLTLLRPADENGNVVYVISKELRNLDSISNNCVTLIFTLIFAD